jgi:hypothetical protein
VISTNLDEKITHPNTTYVALDNQQCFAEKNTHLKKWSPPTANFNSLISYLKSLSSSHIPNGVDNTSRSSRYYIQAS